MERNYFEMKKYIEIRLHRKETAKRLSFQNIENLSIRDTKITTTFYLLKTHQKEHVEGALNFEVALMLIK